MKQLFVFTLAVLGFSFPAMAYNVKCTYYTNNGETDFTPLPDTPKMEGTFEIYAESTFDDVFFQLGMGKGEFTLSAKKPNSDLIYAQASSTGTIETLSLDFSGRSVICFIKDE